MWLGATEFDGTDFKTLPSSQKVLLTVLPWPLTLILPFCPLSSPSVPYLLPHPRHTPLVLCKPLLGPAVFALCEGDCVLIFLLYKIKYS